MKSPTDIQEPAMINRKRALPMTDSPFEMGGSLDERRAQVLEHDLHVQEERRKQLAAQASPFSTPQMRIETWERLHALSLPRSETHKLLSVIAAQTELTLAQVHEEQARRAAPTV